MPEMQPMSYPSSSESIAEKVAHAFTKGGAPLSDVSSLSDAPPRSCSRPAPRRRAPARRAAARTTPTSASIERSPNFVGGVRKRTGQQNSTARQEQEHGQEHEQEQEQERRRSSVVDVIAGEVGPVTIIARTLGVEVGLGHNVVVGLARPVIPLPAVVGGPGASSLAALAVKAQPGSTPVRPDDALEEAGEERLEVVG
eukprot:scaffold4966_cov62-Phaeocystis_antarctica.AAC.7